MLLGLGLNLNKGGFVSVPYHSVLASAFRSRVQSDGGEVGNISCLKSELKELNPTKPAAFTGLLNDYSGAAAAYSLRLLDNTYSGNAIKVRRSSDNAEQDIAFVNNELDTASLETFAGSGDAFVTTWYDQSGSGNDATQTSAAGQPQIVSSGSTILENGKPIVTAKAAQVNTLNINISYSGSNLLSVFSALKLKSGNNWYLSTDNSSTTSPDGVLAWAFSDQLGAYRSQFAIGPDLSLGQYLLSNVWQPSIFESYVNGSLNHNDGSVELIASFDFSSLQMFQSTPSDVGIQEMVIYTSDESTNRTGIETNINDFYSIY